ncbi:hypothetical protein L5515_000295 [Caenorhabditis briggsae]|uniref:F-box associated domain-containing protein n=1 Tax=Caenorhabditis briggsae TaxID=6238 RepID=A0AAE9E1B1_CAEBR|nr:hypothetical protein L5515_000295 [Caenorhabditis briggsae]
MKKLIKSYQIARFEKIDSIRYECNPRGQPLVYIYYKSSSEKIVKIDKLDKNINDYFQLNISGKMIDFRYCDQYQCPVTYCQPHDKVYVIKSLHDHFLDFFGDSVEYHFEAKYGWKSDYFIIPQLQNISTCSIWYYRHGDIKSLEHFFAWSPVFKRIYLFDDLFYEPQTSQFSPESKLYQTESIKIDQRNPNAPDVLHCFQGRQAFLRYGAGATFEIVDFVNRWKRGDVSRLEYLQIESTLAVEFSYDPVLSHIGVRRIDPAKTPPTHIVPKIHIEKDNKPNTEPITSYTYVVRVSDGHVASVLVQGKKFYFGVWDKTEDEFLEMVE